MFRIMPERKRPFRGIWELVVRSTHLRKALRLVHQAQEMGTDCEGATFRSTIACLRQRILEPRHSFDAPLLLSVDDRVATIGDLDA